MDPLKRMLESTQYLWCLEEKAFGLYTAALEGCPPEERSGLEKLRMQAAAQRQLCENLLETLEHYQSRKRQAPFFKSGAGVVLAYVGAGILLGLGAPAGSLLIKGLGTEYRAIFSWVLEEWSMNHWFYLYMTIGSVTAFSLAAVFSAGVHLGLKAKTRDLAVKARVLEDLSEKDPLTGLYNFGYLRERIFVEFERARRFQTPLSVLMIDVNHLKVVNDTHGHPAGDLLLEQVASVLRAQIRMIDTAIRYGGDEFLVVLPVTNQAGAMIAAERIRLKIKELQIDYRDAAIKTTASMGVGTFPAPGVQDVDQIINAADKALYAAKHRGRDTIVCSGDLKPEI